MMKIINYVTPLIALLIAIPGYSAPQKSDTDTQGACPSCADPIVPNTTRYGTTRPDLAELLNQVENKCTPEMLAELKSESEQIKFKIKSNIPDKADHKFYKADRMDPFLKQFNAVGVLTAGPMGETKGYGTAILIDKCFVLTNKHVVRANLEKINQTAKIGSIQYFHVGQPSTCNSSDPMAMQNIKATVVDFGETEDFVVEDWAVLKLESPITTIEPVKTFREVIVKNQLMIRAGYPGSAIRSDDFGASAIRVQPVKLNKIGLNGGLITSDTELRFGLSGGGIFTVSYDENKNPRLSIYAIAKGGDLEITLSEIFSQMAHNGRKIIEEVRRPKAPGTCD